MNSDRRTTANRRNSRKSCGPRSAAGKSIASRNALRHGLAALTHRQSACAEEIERFASKLCNGENDDILTAQARIVAANEMVLRMIDAQKIAVVQRLRDRTAIALAKGDNSFILAKARFLQAWLANKGIGERVPGLLEKYQDQMPPPLPIDERIPPEFRFEDAIVPIRLKALLEESDSIEDQQRARDLARQRIAQQERDEYEALEEAAPDLIRLERYERRTWSRQKRAIREFMNLKMMRDMGRVETRNQASGEQNAM